MRSLRLARQPIDVRVIDDSARDDGVRESKSASSRTRREGRRQPLDHAVLGVDQRDRAEVDRRVDLGKHLVYSLVALPRTHQASVCGCNDQTPPIVLLCIEPECRPGREFVTIQRPDQILASLDHFRCQLRAHQCLLIQAIIPLFRAEMAL